MKSILFALLTSLSFLFMNAQSDSWKVYHNKKLLVNANEENETKNIVAINKTELNKAGELIVMYEEGNPNKEWKRTIAILDEKDINLFEKAEINKIQVSNTILKKLTAGKTKLKIYSWSIPKDPAKAALIRIRRVHLCTLELK